MTWKSAMEEAWDEITSSKVCFCELALFGAGFLTLCGAVSLGVYLGKVVFNG
jgi:hypothetical protein